MNMTISNTQRVRIAYLWRLVVQPRSLNKTNMIIVIVFTMCTNLTDSIDMHCAVTMQYNVFNNSVNHVNRTALSVNQSCQ